TSTVLDMVVISQASKFPANVFEYLPTYSQIKEAICDQIAVSSLFQLYGFVQHLDLE
ncbi:hypothetical protein HAX54_031413, partial [Datura stramonium]|nr:hypothetical protein [Datura stramonium]